MGKVRPYAPRHRWEPSGNRHLEQCAHCYSERQPKSISRWKSSWRWRYRDYGKAEWSAVRPGCIDSDIRKADELDRAAEPKR
jgi:hypothetical protein